MRIFLVFFAAYSFLCSTCFAQVAVKGYTKKDGTYVRPHTRAAPSKGYYNSVGDSSARKSAGVGDVYGESYGTRNRSGNSQRSELGGYYYPSGKENKTSVQVDGYRRSNGTYVQPYTRTSPNKTDDDNWSTKGNLNLGTGKPGYKKNNIWK